MLQRLLLFHCSWAIARSGSFGLPFLDKLHTVAGYGFLQHFLFSLSAADALLLPGLVPLGTLAVAATWSVSGCCLAGLSR